eukprot:COSAG01_NODE_946_length_12533_cov_4.570532_1_plen_238_part_10
MSFNFVDSSTASTVLVSSRVYSTLKRDSASSSSSSLGSADDADAADIVRIQLPTEAVAVKMLLSTAGITVGDKSVPKEAFELVKFCNMLPLALSIAGQLVNELELEAASDWEGIVSIMKEEYADGAQQSVEDTVIRTSLNSISGSHTKNVKLLLSSLALTPEDTVVPLDMLALMFQAHVSTDEKPAPRPRIIMLRRFVIACRRIVHIIATQYSSEVHIFTQSICEDVQLFRRNVLSEQ